MSSRTVELASPIPRPARTGQHTAVEQSRAVAEVFAQVQIARQDPRDEAACYAKMRRACSSQRLAAKAFYEYSRGGETVGGMTIHVATALALCWGNLLHGLAEMSRDDVHGQSEMQAYCWELESNSRHAHTFIIPHVRRAGGKNKLLDDPRDIYENNTNNGNRRWREAIFKALPVEFLEEAEQILRSTLTEGIEKSKTPLAKQIEEALAGFQGDFGVAREQVEAKAGRPASRWDAKDLAQLRILWDSLKRGDLRVEDAFPTAKVTAEEVAPRATEPTAAHWDHAPSEFVDGCPGCIAESTSADQEAAQDGGGDDADA